MPIAKRTFRSLGNIRLAGAATLALTCWVAAGADTTSLAGRPAVVPGSPISLFNGKDLGGFYRWLPETGQRDPDRVFTVVDNIDGAPAIRISGQHHGGLVTCEAYANYKLVAEYRWGILTWGSKKTRARDSGVLLHCQGDDGNYAKDFRSPWMCSVEFQIIEGGTGDILLLNGFIRESARLIVPRLTVSVRPGELIWNPHGTPQRFENVRLDWRHRDPNWSNTLGFRGANDVEKPVGEWNRIEAICEAGNLAFFVNGMLVNEGRGGSATAGKVLFQSEGAEIFFRRIELQPLDP